VRLGGALHSEGSKAATGRHPVPISTYIFNIDVYDACVEDCPLRVLGGPFIRKALGLIGDIASTTCACYGGGDGTTVRLGGALHSEGSKAVTG